ncbi:MAG: hypothetical protein M1818_003606 [Claussenomyces sp. TS43310]|nr:MAG: hypothetical protein M1818_003606 [Claussenomyces sp. TS43310]
MAPGQPPRYAEPVAIVGMSCRLPGGASSTSKLWDLLVDGRSGQCEIPKSRFNADAFYHPDANKAGTINGRGGYFLQEDVRLFDNAFFGINNLEAKYLDPQQRQLLEVVYECFESAGVTLEEISGANVGCYVANFTSDYVTMQAKSPELYHRYSATGFGPTILANRISHCFNIHGPSLVLDTACSSSLYALHVACAALNAGECDAAIVAGANLVQSPETYIAMSKAGVLSGTSISHTFDSSADGYGRGEGVAALYLKRLDASVKDGNPVRSVIRGTAVNSNGHTPGITLPSVPGQEAVIRKAYAMAGLPIDETVYVEAHGTGTPTGDPIEVEALSRSLRPKSGQPLLIGSVKTNIGHGEAVSGISSIIKATLALEQKVIPPTIGIQSLNPDLKLAERNIEVVTNLKPWPKNALQRISINSFGYGGANAHAILDAASMHLVHENGYLCNGDASVGRSFILPFSANCPQSLAKNMEAIVSSKLASHCLRDLAYTLGARRSSMPARGYLLATETSIDAKFSTSPLRAQPPLAEKSPLPLAFIFTGQGAQWPGMGRELLSRFPIFRQKIQDLDSHLAKLPQSPLWTLKGTILEPEGYSTIYKASRSQPVCTAVQIALIELLKSWDIQPNAVIGHSSGEICAAYAAGFVTAEEAIAIAYYRGLAVSKICAKGAMMAVGLGSEAVAELISSLGMQRDIRVACINSPESTTVSGESDAVNKLFLAFQDGGVFVRKLKTDDKAYHSHLMETVGQEYEELLLPIFLKRQSEGLQEAEVSMFSSVTSRLAGKGLVGTPSYWRTNLESPVNFSSAMEILLLSGPYHMIEVGPHPALGQPVRDIQQSLSSVQSSYASTLSRGRNSETSMLDLAGSLYVNGYKLPFLKINGLSSASTGSAITKLDVKAQVIHDLPTYAWHHQDILWNESRTSSEFRNLKHKRHDLLGSRIPGTSGEAAWWRNTLKAQEVPWLQDHKLGQTIVFPAAGYLAMAIEGLCQMHDCSMEGTINLRQVHLVNLLILRPDKDGVEISMQLEPARLSSVTSSNIWWRFEISSNAAETTTIHANGLIAMKVAVTAIDSRFPYQESVMETQATRTWYNKLAKEGLCFGPEFRSMTEISTDRTKKLPCAGSKTIFRQGGDQDGAEESHYIIHPITIDSLLQAAIVASTNGVVQALHGRVPVTIGQLSLLTNNSTNSSDLCTIRAGSKKVGFGTAILGGELENSSGKIIAQMQEVRAIAYTETSLQPDSSMERNPTLRILWKPDVSFLSSEDTQVFANYLERFASFLPRQLSRSGLAYFAGAVDLVTHQNGRMHILEIDDNGNEDLKELLDQTSIGSSPKHFETYTRAAMSPDGELVVQDQCEQAAASKGQVESKRAKVEPAFDLILVSSATSASKLLNHHMNHITKYLAPDGVLIFTNDRSTSVHLDEMRFSVLTGMPKESDASFTIARASNVARQNFTSAGSRVVLICTNSAHALNQIIRADLSQSFGTEVALISLEDVTYENVPLRSTVVSTIELEDPVVATMTAAQLQAVKIMAENASNFLWITGGRLFKAQRPEFALVLGLARSLMLERPSLKMPVLDLDNGLTGAAASSKHVIAVLHQAMHSNKPDFEYRQYDGILYNSRFVPDVSLNRRFRQVQDAEVIELPVADAGNCSLAMKNAGQIDSLRFEEAEKRTAIKPGYVEVQVKAVGINAKDFYALSDKVDIRESTCALEFSGIVIRTGATDSKFAPGDRVVVMAPSHFATLECVPEWACCKLGEEEDLKVMSTVPLVFSTALYALENRAHLQADESILIHSAAGGAGIAAIQIAQLIGAEIFATVGTAEKKEFLIENFNISEDHIFNSHDATFLPGILKATAGKGVDVVLNSLTGDLLHESWQACAEFGTFVEIGKRDISDSSRLDMRVFDRGVTFTAFDLTNLYWSDSEAKRNVWHKLLHRSVDLLRGKKIKAITPLKVFPASEIVQAFRYFSLSTRMGKVAVTFEEPSTLHVVPKKHRTRFSPEKTYLLIGCLGGLGRSLSRWMLRCGARHFVFIGRSGTDKLAAKNMVSDLQAAGADIAVIRGDVARYEDVERAVSEATHPIGGVVQAAMSIHVALFNEMACETWHMGISQKVKGAWNLHNALRGKDSQLDFFLMLSSITGSIGTATESNYCAANAFLDSFGSYRRSIGLPAVALGLGMISEVGFLHENPETEAVLLRKGVHSFTEEELLQIVDISLTPPPADAVSVLDNGVGEDHYIQGHILTGLELHGFQRIRDAGFMRGTTVLEDPRCTFIAGAFANSAQTSADGADAASGAQYPRAVTAALAGNESASVPEEALVEAVQAVVVDRIATLLLVASTELQESTQLADFGMESMLAAEFRSDMFRAFKVDVPFAVLMDKRTRVRTVAELVGQGLLEMK